MTSARKFLFGDDFREPSPARTAEQEGRDRAEHEEALRGAYEAGLEAGRQQAEAETSRRLAESIAGLEAVLPTLFERSDVAGAAAEAECLRYFDTLARKLAGSALDERPLAAVADAAAAAFRHLRGVPHLAVRVGSALVEDADVLLRRVAREHGFEGRVIVMGDEDMRPGDVRLDWVDGGVVRDRRAFETAVDQALAAAKTSDAGGEHMT